MQSVRNNVIARRVWHPAVNAQMQSVSVSSSHESDGFDLQHITSPALSSSPANAVYTSGSACSSFTAFGGYATNMAQETGPLVQAVAEPMAMTGSALQASTRELLEVIGRNKQNLEGMASLKSRLVQLSNHLRDVPAAQDPVERWDRDSLNRLLQGTAEKLRSVKKPGTIKKLGTVKKRGTVKRREAAKKQLKSKLAAVQRIKTRVTQTIMSCSNSIQEYLLYYMFAARKRLQTAIFAATLNVQSPMFNIRGCVMLVDATGYQHQIPLHFCTSYQQLARMLQAVFEPDRDEAQLQTLLLQQRWYDLCIDHNTGVTELTSHDWRTIEAGTTITMRAVIPSWRPQHTYYCHFCRVENITSMNLLSSPSVDCQSCGRRFHVHKGKNSAYKNEYPIAGENNPTRGAFKNILGKRDLIRNFCTQNLDKEEKYQEFKLEENLLDELFEEEKKDNKWFDEELLEFLYDDDDKKFEELFGDWWDDDDFKLDWWELLLEDGKDDFDFEKLLKFSMEWSFVRDITF